MQLHNLDKKFRIVILNNIFILYYLSYCCLGNRGSFFKLIPVAKGNPVKGFLNTFISGAVLPSLTWDKGTGGVGNWTGGGSILWISGCAACTGCGAGGGSCGWTGCAIGSNFGGGKYPTPAAFLGTVGGDGFIPNAGFEIFGGSRSIFCFSPNAGFGINSGPEFEDIGFFTLFPKKLLNNPGDLVFGLISGGVGVEEKNENGFLGGVTDLGCEIGGVGVEENNESGFLGGVTVRENNGFCVGDGSELVKNDLNCAFGLVFGNSTDCCIIGLGLLVKNELFGLGGSTDCGTIGLGLLVNNELFGLGGSTDFAIGLDFGLAEKNDNKSWGEGDLEGSGDMGILVFKIFVELLPDFGK